MDRRLSSSRSPASGQENTERDWEIDAICQMIHNVTRAGIPAVEYNFSILSMVRTKPTVGRGGALYSTFNYAEATPENLPFTEPGKRERR
jgi:mannonate dehydratase